MVPTIATEDRILRQPIEQVDKTVIDKLLADVEAVPEGHYWTIDDGDPLYTAPTDVMLVPVSTVRDPGETMIGGECLFADFYDLTGRRIPLAERPTGWFEQQAEIRKPGPNWGAENAVHRLGDDYVVVGRGQFFMVGEVELQNGERALEVVSRDIYLELQRQRRVEERQAYLDANPIIEASMPWWATDVYVSEDDMEDHAAEVNIEYNFGISVDDLYLTQTGTFKDGKVTLGEAVIQNGHNAIRRDGYKALAGELHAFADVLDRLVKEGTK